MQKTRFSAEISCFNPNLNNKTAACLQKRYRCQSFHEIVTVRNLTVNDFSVCNVNTVFIMLNPCILKKNQNITWESPEAYSEPCQASKMARFAKIFNGFDSVNIFAKLFI